MLKIFSFLRAKKSTKDTSEEPKANFTITFSFYKNPTKIDTDMSFNDGSTEYLEVLLKDTIKTEIINVINEGIEKHAKLYPDSRKDLQEMYLNLSAHFKEMDSKPSDEPLVDPLMAFRQMTQ